MVKKKWSVANVALSALQLVANSAQLMAFLNQTSLNPRLTDAVGQETSEISFYV